MMILKLVLTILVFEFLIVAVPAQSALSLPNESLRGLHNITVVIDDVSTFAHPVGSSADTPDPNQMKSGIELQLRKAGFTIVNSEEQVQKEKVASLHVTLKAQKDSAGYNYFSLRVQLVQEVILQRDASVTIQASTWESVAAGYGFGKKQFQQTTCQVISFFVLSHKKINGGSKPGERPRIEDIMCLDP